MKREGAHGDLLSFEHCFRGIHEGRLEDIIEYATLGNTGLLLSKLCSGTMTFGDGRGLYKAIGAVGQAAGDELLKTSIDGGINFFDTADNYTEGGRLARQAESE